MRGMIVSDQLLDLAREKFGTLSEAEEKLFQAAANGELANYSAEEEDNNDPGRAADWPEERVLKANHIAWLCIDREASQMVTHKGIHVKGARIDGELDLQFVKIQFPLYFEKSAFMGDIYLEYAEIPALNLQGTHTGPITAVGLKVKGPIYLINGFRAKGEVCLLNATIGGYLNCGNGQFIHPEGHALCADRMKVAGSVFLRDQFKAEGEVRLISTTIGSNLECDKGQFVNPEGYALNADGIKVNGCVFLRDNFKAKGIIRLIGATIGGDLDCDKGQFINPGNIALHAERVKIQRAIFLCNDFKAEGEVSLLGATIGRQLNCEKGLFINPKGKALNADALNIKGSIFLRNNFEAKGEVCLSNATIGGNLVYVGVVSHKEVTLNLKLARIGTMLDDKKSWPEFGNLFLDGLVYDQIGEDAPRDAKTRIDWLRRQPSNQFRSQPYEQLAAVLRKNGQEKDEKLILIAKNEDRNRLTDMSWIQYVGHWLLGVTIGYGYRPMWALWWMLGFVTLGSILFGIGTLSDVMTPTKMDAYVSVTGSENLKLSENYPKLNVLVYSLDAFVQLVDFHQVNYWLPNANRVSELISIKGLTLRGGTLLRWYMWLHIILGWILTSLLIVGLTGLVRK